MFFAPKFRSFHAKLIGTGGNVMAEAIQTSDLANKRDLHELELRITKWVVGLALAQIGLLIGILTRLAG
jgi:hypothetical protein